LVDNSGKVSMVSNNPRRYENLNDLAKAHSFKSSKIIFDNSSVGRWIKSKRFGGSELFLLMLMLFFFLVQR
jgi:hypothetical protein